MSTSWFAADRTPDAPTAVIVVAIESPHVHDTALQLSARLRTRYGYVLNHDHANVYTTMVLNKEAHEIRAEIDRFLSGDV